MGNEERVSVNYKPLPKEVKIGGLIMVHDGKRKLEIIDIKGNEVITKVLVGGEIKSRRGINLPGAYLSISSITDKDKADLEFGLKNDVDFVAFSFVRRAADIVELRSMLNKARSKAKIIAKVEDVEGLENIDEIIKLVDGVMVARGDLAIEIGAENVPMNQKMMIKKCNEQGKIVITATHMLESMIKNPVPTRAEVSDIANAILDGTDAIMLSEETTLGDFPVEAVQVMKTVSNRVENDPMYKELVTDVKHPKRLAANITDAVTSEVVDTAHSIGAKYIVALTANGFTARMISRYKPLQPILGFTYDKKTFNQLLFTFGVTPVLIPKMQSFELAKKAINDHILKNKLAVKGDKIIIASAMPFGKMKETNTLIVETL
jgi:pyruvate kinase